MRSKNMEIIKNRLISAIMLFALILPTVAIISPEKTVLADTHVHTSACYPSGAVCHTAHTDSCFSQVARAEKVPCGGTWRYQGRQYDYKPNSYAYKDYQYWWCSRCSSYIDCFTIYYSNGPRFHSPERAFAPYHECSTGSIITYPTVKKESTTKEYNVTALVYKCERCGERMYVPNIADAEYYDIYEIMTPHKERTVYDKVLTCTRDIGGWYNADGTKATPICGKAAHVHSSDCYAGTLHTKHTTADGCYNTITSDVLCEGTWQITDYFSNMAGRYYYSGKECKGCGGTVQQTDMFRLAGVSEISADLVFKSEDPYQRCGQCGNVGTRSNSYYSCDYNYIYILRCSGCGDMAYYCGIGFAQSGYYNDDTQKYVYASQGVTHGYHTVTTETLKCTRQLGKYYVQNANGSYTESGCVCDKVITEMTPIQSSYLVQQGESVIIKANAVFLNGVSKQIICTYKTGTGAGELNPNILGTPQTVTVYAESAYPYSDTAQNRTPKTATVTMTYMNTFPVAANAGVNGSIVIGDGTTSEYSPGSTVNILVTPNSGYHINKITENGVTGTQTKALSFTPNANGVYTYSFTMPMRAVTVSATFAPNTYSVTYDANGGSWNDGNLRTVNIVFGSSYVDADYPADPTKSGAKFMGWYNASNIKVDKYSSHNITDNLILHAVWIDIPDNVLVQQTYDDPILYPDNPVAIEGFTINLNSFWRVDEAFKNGTGATLINNTISKLTEDTTYFGHWDANHYTVTLNAAGGSFNQTDITSIPDASSDGYMRYVNGSKAEKEVIYHTTYGALPKPTRSGYTFGGWTLNGNIVPLDYVTIADNVELVAHWISGIIPTPGTSAFPVGSITVTDAGSVYDPTKAIPSTETVVIRGKISPWDFIIDYATSGSVTKITGLYVYQTQRLAIFAESSNGKSCFDSNESNIKDFKNQLSVDITDDTDKVVYTTSDYSESAGTGIKLIHYKSATVSDAVYLNGVKISITGSGRRELIPNATYNFTFNMKLLDTARDGSYALKHTQTYFFLENVSAGF